MASKFTFLGTIALGSCLLTGCLEFKSQTMSYRHDKAADTLRIFQDFHGIFGADGDKKKKAGQHLSSSEESELDSVLTGQQTFFFDNWIFVFDRDNYAEMRDKLKSPAGKTEAKLSPEGLAKLENLLDLLLANVRVENGPFYLDDKKQLSGVQYVTISKCSSVFSAINEFGPFLLKQLAEEEEGPSADKAAILKFAKNPQPLIELDGNALTLRWPVSRETFDEGLVENSDEAETMAAMKRAGIAISFANDVVTISAGKANDEVTGLSLDVSDKPYTDNAVASARKHHTVKEDFDVAAAAKAFLMQGKRATP